MYTDLSNEAKLILGNLGNLHKADNLNGGHRYSYMFPNGFGISIIKSYVSYGQQDDLWEIGVLDDKGALIYDTEITDDVIGFLTEEQVLNYAKQIARLDENGRDTDKYAKLLSMIDEIIDNMNDQMHELRRAIKRMEGDQNE